MMLAPPVERLMDLALLEDLAYGDITTENLFSGQETTTAYLHVRQSAVISGTQIAKTVFEKVDSRITCTINVPDGEPVTAGTTIMTLEGPTASILKAERLALNFLQHLSGIATLTYQFAGAISGTKAKITHTRKTIPGLRHLEIEAVVHGGGSPHRSSLSHAVLIKDNHIQALGSIEKAVAKIRQSVGHTSRLEVECDTLDQVDEALTAGVDIILLDNMSIPMLKEAVKKIKGQAIIEASGNVTLSNVMEIANTGVDFISTSQITLSTTAVDLGLDFE
jgi:nicotinate-nucleotide pyrophosphorylase (carboxylating)